MLDLIGALTIAAAAALPPADSTVLLREKGEPSLAVFHEPGNGSSILYIHGSTFPTALSIAYRLEGRSWADDLHARGFDVWSLDFAGYGRSDRPATTPNSNPGEIPGRAAEAEREIARVVRYIKARRKTDRLSLIAHSWGTLPAGMFAAHHPGDIDKLVLFGPVAQRQGQRKAPTAPSRLMTAEDQWESFQSGVPAGERSPISKPLCSLGADLPCHRPCQWEAQARRGPGSGRTRRRLRRGVERPFSVRPFANPRADTNCARGMGSDRA